MKRTVMLRRTNPERRAAALARDFGDQAARCRAAPCCVCERHRITQHGPTVPHHDPSRGAGGTDRDTMPLCNYHHRMVHRIGRTTFWRHYDMDPRAVVERMRNPIPTTDDGVPY